MSDTMRLALVGNPNSGKSALFNTLTGMRQKVANYPGVTVETRCGLVQVGDAATIEMIDLPGAYTLAAHSLDEAITRDVLTGKHAHELPPDAVICVIDATCLRSQLRFVLEMQATGRPLVVALNMMDLAERDGLEIDIGQLSADLGVPVVPTVAIRKSGVAELRSLLRDVCLTPNSTRPAEDPGDIRQLQRTARDIAARAIKKEGMRHKLTRRLDTVLLHPVAGPLVLAAMLLTIFQAVFSWAEAPMNWIDAAMVFLQEAAAASIGPAWLESLIVDGAIAGVGSVIIFLPQILILFLFILLLEQSGYMARAAVIMDRLMAVVGLNGRAFIPLLSSFACAIPGIMAARAVPDEKDRLTTILIAPLMTCAARLPVYTLIIAAFIPNTTVWGILGLQGLVMFVLYVAGILSAMAAALILRRTVTRGPKQGFMMVMPKYQMPRLRDIAVGLWSRASAFLRRAGTVILATTVLLWVLSTYPGAPADAEDPAILYSFAGMIGGALEVVLAPIGFSWDIAIALIPAMAAREVAVAALGTVHALSGAEEVVTASLVETLRGSWSLPTALAFLAWFVFAPQCFATMAVARRETNSWRWPLFMFAYLFGLAYVAAGVTYHIASAIV